MNTEVCGTGLAHTDCYEVRVCRFEVCGVELTCSDAFSMRSAFAYLRCVG